MPILVDFKKIPHLSCVEQRPRQVILLRGIAHDEPPAVNPKHHLIQRTLSKSASKAEIRCFVHVLIYNSLFTSL